MRRASLFVRYWASLALLVTLPIVVSGVIEGWTVYNAGYAAARERQTQVAERAALVVEAFVRPPIQRLTNVSRVPWDYPTATNQFDPEMRRIAVQFQFIERVQRIDARGEVVRSFSQTGRGRPLTEGELGDIARFRNRANPAPQEVIAMSRGAPGEWSIAISERAPDYFFVADFSKGTVGGALGEPDQWGDNVVFVLDRAGAILAHSTDVSLVQNATNIRTLAGWPSVEELTRIVTAPEVQEGNLGEIAVRVASDATSGGQWFAAFRRIEPLGWTVFALAPSAGLHAEIRSAVARTAWIVLSANIVALLLALGWARQMSRPLESLTEASQRVAQGDLGARAEVLSDDDIGHVSRQFNSMVDQLRVSYTELESRVAEKTAELEKANRHKSEFLAQMSHELRTPLNAVIGFSRALDTQRKFLGPLSEKQEEYVRDIHASGLHLLALINDLLDLAKIEAGRMDLHVGVIDVPRVVDSALALVRDRADAQGVKLHARIAADVSTWVADERKFKQILLNLLSNAVKFTGHDGTVDVDVAVGASEPDKRPELRISVTDTGIGIPPDQVSRLFTAFGQLSQSEVTAREGTGLGLALSRRLVELHGGRIWVDSQPGRGSTFYFTLPEREWPPNLS